MVCTKTEKRHFNFLSEATDVESVCLLYLSELCKMSMSLLIRPDQTTIKPIFDVGQESSSDQPVHPVLNCFILILGSVVGFIASLLS